MLPRTRLHCSLWPSTPHGAVAGFLSWGRRQSAVPVRRARHSRSSWRTKCRPASPVAPSNHDDTQTVPIAGFAESSRLRNRPPSSAPEWDRSGADRRVGGRAMTDSGTGGVRCLQPRASSGSRKTRLTGATRHERIGTASILTVTPLTRSVVTFGMPLTVTSTTVCPDGI